MKSWSVDRCLHSINLNCAIIKVTLNADQLYWVYPHIQAHFCILTTFLTAQCWDVCAATARYCVFSSLLFCHYLNHSTFTIPMRLQDSCHTSTCTIKDVLILTDKEIWFSCAIMWQNIFRNDSANPVTFDFALRDTFKIIFSFQSSDHLETFTLKIAALVWFLLRFALQ